MVNITIMFNITIIFIYVHYTWDEYYYNDFSFFQLVIYDDINI